jgi:DHA3 family macrolide efflux protein-like MFS transporter
MLPKEHYTRANSMMELAGYGANVLAPLLAGALLGLLGAGRGLRVILLIDVVSFTFAIGTVLFAHIPQPKTSDAGREAEGHFWQEALYGLRYILRQPSLLGLQLLLMTGHFFDTVAFTLLAPMILARTGNDEMLFGLVQTLGAIGGIVGGVAVSAWGGFRRRIHGVLLGWTFTSLFGTILMGLGRGAPAWMGLPIWGAGLFLGEVCFPLINGSNEAIWQAKVPPDVQGRVFSYRRVLSWITAPLAIFITGPLADRVMEPAMREGGTLVEAFGWLVGTGPGAGMSLIFVFGGVLVALIMASGYLFPVIRDIEGLLPDHDMGEEETA